MTKQVLFQVQAAEMGFLWRVHSVVFHDKSVLLWIYKAVNVESFLLWIERSQLWCFLATWAECSRKNWQIKSWWQHAWENNSGQRSTKDQVAWLHLWPDLVSSWYGDNEPIKVAKNCEVSCFILELMSPWPSTEEYRVQNYIIKGGSFGQLFMPLLKTMQVNLVIQ